MKSLTGNDTFTLRLVTFHEVFNELKLLQSDSSTGPDLILAKFKSLLLDILQAF